MSLRPLLRDIAQSPAFAALDEVCAEASLSILAPDGLRPFVLSYLARKRSQESPLVVVTRSGRRADQLAEALAPLCEAVAVFPSWETLPHERLSPRADTMARRIATAHRIVHPDARHPHSGPLDVVIVPVRAFIQPVVSDIAEREPVVCRPGDTVAPDELVNRLVAAGYERTDMVERRGEVAQRGAIVDVFSPLDDHPVRIEFFGDDVEEVRFFSVADQRTLADAPGGLWAPSARELLLTDDMRQRARQAQTRLPGAVDLLEPMSEGIPVEGMETLLPALADAMVPLIDLLPASCRIVVDEPEPVRTRAASLADTTREFAEAAWHAAAQGAKVPLNVGLEPFVSLDCLRETALGQGRHWWELTDLRAPEDESGVGQIDLGAEGSPAWRGKIADAARDLHDYSAAGWTMVMATSGPGVSRRLGDALAEEGLACRVSANGEDIDASFPGLTLTPAPMLGGFTLRERRLLVLAERDLTGRQASQAARRKLPQRRRGAIVDPLTLKAGDYIVHEKHGIGRFCEMATRTVAGVTREYLVVEYAGKRGRPSDRLFVPTDSLALVTRYTGSDTPALSKMGGSDWQRTKAKVRAATREVAAELIRLYAARQATKGHAFGPDTPWQAQLEESFAYVETPDQLVTIDEVKADMEREVPMDRLLCGDVGYGKTEVAVRAAFKAIQDNKQVALLVPTTLLVQQHFETFSERYAGFPVTVERLSRFSTPKDAERVKEGLADGSIDLVIGTHGLVSGTVTFKDLGLVIIDEEQRFGVEHKEALKALRTNVDVLSMSATPIPRTLEMAITGIREMSTLQTPPEERHPVLTYVGAYRDQQVKAAIAREMLREGQVFYVHNRVASIDDVAAKIASLVPDARVAVAHGKMSESQLESVMVDFWNHEFDVLVCTTIVETGLDIANANTLIVDGAHKMGLSQLHQLRGRVGRSRERAYAYFFYDADKVLTATAHERLSTIATNTDLGAGTAVAQKDLEIRGAGNLLGDQQSGHIAGVGFDLYVRMVAEAVTNFKEGTSSESEDVRIELPIDAHIPPSYIPSERLRLEIYQKISAARTGEERDDIVAELEDRYGKLPRPVQLLFVVATIRELARAIGLTDVVAQGKFIRFGPVELADSQRLRLKRLHPRTVFKTALRQVLVPLPTPSGLGAKPLEETDVADFVSGVITHILTPFGASLTSPDGGDGSRSR